MKTKKSYSITDFSSFICIGKLYNGRKFRDEYSNFHHANCINMYDGRLYGVLKETGKKVLLKTMYN